MKKLFSVLLVLGAVVTGLSAQNKKVIAAQIEEIRSNGKFVDDNGKRLITVTAAKVDAQGTKLQTVSFSKEDLTSGQTKIENFFVSEHTTPDEYIVSIQIVGPVEFREDYCKYFAIFYGGDPGNQVRFKGVSVKPTKTSDGDWAFLIAGLISKEEFGKMQRASALQIVLTNEREFYSYEQEDMGLHNFSTNKLFQTALKEFFLPVK